MVYSHPFFLARARARTHTHRHMSKRKEEKAKNYAAYKAQAQAQSEKKLKETLAKLAKCDKAQKSVEASIESSERQAQEQICHLKEAEGSILLKKN